MTQSQFLMSKAQNNSDFVRLVGLEDETVPILNAKFVFLVRNNPIFDCLNTKQCQVCFLSMKQSQFWLFEYEPIHFFWYPMNNLTQRSSAYLHLLLDGSDRASMEDLELDLRFLGMSYCMVYLCLFYILVENYREHLDQTWGTSYVW